MHTLLTYSKLGTYLGTYLETYLYTHCFVLVEDTPPWTLMYPLAHSCDHRAHHMCIIELLPSSVQEHTKMLAKLLVLHSLSRSLGFCMHCSAVLKVLLLVFDMFLCRSTFPWTFCIDYQTFWYVNYLFMDILSS